MGRAVDVLGSFFYGCYIWGDTILAKLAEPYSMVPGICGEPGINATCKYAGETSFSVR